MLTRERCTRCSSHHITCEQTRLFGKPLNVATTYLGEVVANALFFSITECPVIKYGYSPEQAERDIKRNLTNGGGVGGSNL